MYELEQLVLRDVFYGIVILLSMKVEELNGNY